MEDVKLHELTCVPLKTWRRVPVSSEIGIVSSKDLYNQDKDDRLVIGGLLTTDTDTANVNHTLAFHLQRDYQGRFGETGSIKKGYSVQIMHPSCLQQTTPLNSFANLAQSD